MVCIARLSTVKLGKIQRWLAGVIITVTSHTLSMKSEANPKQFLLDESDDDLEKSFHDDMVHMMGALSYYDDDDTIGSHSVSLRSISKRLPTSLGDDTIAWLVLKEDMFSYFNHFTDTFSMQTQGSIEV